MKSVNLGTSLNNYLLLRTRGKKWHSSPDQRAQWVGHHPEKRKVARSILARAHAWVAGSVLGGGGREATYWCFSLMLMFLCLSPYLPLSLKINKIFILKWHSIVYQLGWSFHSQPSKRKSYLPTEIVLKRSTYSICKFVSNIFFFTYGRFKHFPMFL